MNDLILYAILAIMGLVMAYVVVKVRQPIEISGTKEKREKESFVDDIGEIGTILQELKPEIVKGLNLKEEQEKSLEHWINGIDKTLKSKLVKYALRKFLK